MTFNISKNGRCTSFVSGFGTGESSPRSALPMEATNLNGLLELNAAPNIIKIDIEGMDHLALRGASKVLASRPTLILEATDGNREEIGQILHRYGYRLLDTRLQPVTKMPLCNLVATAKDGSFSHPPPNRAPATAVS